jgi:hypothetical protein
MAQCEQDREAVVVGTIDNGPARRLLLLEATQKTTVQEALEKKSSLVVAKSSTTTTTTDDEATNTDDADDVAAAAAAAADNGGCHDKNRITEPSSFDVLFGRGKPYQEHEGNRRLHQCVEYYRDSYSRSLRRDKMVIAQTIVCLIKDSSQHPGRFLRRLKGPDEEYWCEVSDMVAREKVSHALRAKQPPQKSPPPPQQRRRRGSSPSSSSPPPRPILPAPPVVVESSWSIRRRANVSSSGVVETSTIPVELLAPAAATTRTRKHEVGETEMTLNGGVGGGYPNSVSSAGGLRFGTMIPPTAAAAAASATFPGSMPTTTTYPNPYVWNHGLTTTTTGTQPWRSSSSDDSLYYARNLPLVLPASSSSFLSQIVERRRSGHYDMGLFPNGVPLPFLGEMDPFLLEAMIQLGQRRRRNGDGNDIGGGGGGGLGRNHT